MQRLAPILALVAALTAAKAEARDHAGQFSLGAGAGLITEAPWASSAFKDAVTTGPRFSLFGRWHYLSHHSGLELSYDSFHHGGIDLSSRSLIGSYFWRFDINGPVHPIVGFGLGHSWTKNYFRTGDYDTFVSRIRIGAEVELSPRWDLAVHLDHFTIFRNFGDEPNLASLSPSISFVRFFGDYYSPEEFEAARSGKPYEGPPTPLLPSQAAPAVANADADGDGIADAQDRCANTVTGVRVNSLGCGPDQRFNVTPELHFAFQKAELLPGADDALTEVVKLLSENSSLVAEVQGHTDTQGTEEQNDRLSRHRAEVVRERLIRHFHIAAGRLRAKGYGSRFPIAASQSPEQHARNRRVVVRFSEKR
jgi:outer membrane protein OmpA-like peptidoglycan-associated protein